jgi:pyridoxamine 5'-phosphate oxidase
MSDKFADIRRQYSDRGLTVGSMRSHPIDQFKQWFEHAIKHSDRDLANAMTLATADRQGRPSARIILLKHVDREGFVFYTNYNSRKGRELRENPMAALVFWWPSLERQVRASGTVEKLPTEWSDRYFASRPRASQLSAWASRQSREIERRNVLLERLRTYQEQYEGEEVPRPDYWGGYRLQPVEVEFWQGQPNRLHDRVSYEAVDGTWERRRLAP